MSTKQHRWKQSWPGNWCLDCGLEDPFENTDISLINCPACAALPATQEGFEVINTDCKACSGMGVVVNPDLVIPPCTRE